MKRFFVSATATALDVYWVDERCRGVFWGRRMRRGGGRLGERPRRSGPGRMAAPTRKKATRRLAGRTSLDVGEIVRRHGEGYRQRHVPRTTQRKALEARVRCRTAVLGGHLDVCGQCGLQRAPAASDANRRWAGGCKGTLPAAAIAPAPPRDRGPRT